MQKIYDEMRIAVLEGEEERAALLAKEAIEQELDLEAVMNEGFLKGIMEAGQLYEEGEYFLPELICSADAMKAALEILDDRLRQEPLIHAKKGIVVLATVQGDVHDIGKTIVGAMLTAAGYEIHDLGADVENQTVLEAVKEIKPNILGLSALLTTTMEEQGNILELLRKNGLRDSLSVIVGGAPVSREWSDKIGADGYSDNAMDAVMLADRLILERSNSK